MRPNLNWWVVVASVGGLGFSPVAPGTVASAFGMVLYLVLEPSWHWVFGFVVVLALLGIVVSGYAEKSADRRDPSWVVVDELVGYGVSVLGLPSGVWAGLLAFFVFRFFDIIKPPPVNTVENYFKGGTGIMLDDIVAGVLSNLVLRVIFTVLGWD